ncbi:MAG TPA: RDD family protein [Opitutaceae bacterium]|nr:RDD family protein [Opitutaceae bacterium]
MESVDPANPTPPENVNLPPGAPPSGLVDTGSGPGGRTIAGFWRRVIAFCIDSLVMGVTGSIVGFSAFDRLAAMGQWAKGIGFLIAAIYFTIGYSRIGDGRTIGKRLLKLEVVDRAGRHISPGRAFVRFLVLGVPFFLNGVTITNPAGNVVVGILVPILGLSLVYLLVFNRRTRQSTHDLLVGTYVVNASGEGSPTAERVWRGHYVAVGALSAAVLTIASVGGLIASRSGLLRNLIGVRERLIASPGVADAGVFVGRSLLWVNGAKSRVDSITITVRTKKRPADYDGIADRSAAIVLENDPDARSANVINVVVVYGYDLGIARASISKTLSHSPSDWASLSRP